MALACLLFPEAASAQDLAATITINNTTSGGIEVVDYAVSGTITPRPHSMGAYSSVDFQAKQTQDSVMTGHITYFQCRLDWTIAPASDKTYAVKATTSNPAACTVTSATDARTGDIHIEMTNH